MEKCNIGIIVKVEKTFRFPWGNRILVRAKGCAYKGYKDCILNIPLCPPWKRELKAITNGLYLIKIQYAELKKVIYIFLSFLWWGTKCYFSIFLLPLRWTQKFNWISVGGPGWKEKSKCLKVESIWHGLSPSGLRIQFCHCAQVYNQLVSAPITLVE